MRVVAALGGNALLRRGGPAGIDAQRDNVRKAAAVLAEIGASHELIVTHGNGPQVGMLALQSTSFQPDDPDPLDVLGAESEGMIGYLIEQEIESADPSLRAAALLTQVVVDPDDPAFAHPVKPIGPGYGEATARELAARHGWSVARDEGAWRRVVASPEPRWTVEIAAIQALLAAGIVVICSGGGGVPVTVGVDGALGGVEAVVDKDLAAALLARELEADALLLLTDVPGVERDHGTPRAVPLDRATPAELRALDLPAGSMKPKAEAAARFSEARGGITAICRLEDASLALAREAGTQVRRAAGIDGAAGPAEAIGARTDG